MNVVNYNTAPLCVILRTASLNIAYYYYDLECVVWCAGVPSVLGINLTFLSCLTLAQPRTEAKYIHLLTYLEGLKLT